MKLFLLGAGKPAHGDKPAALKQISATTKVLDWLIHSFESAVDVEDIYFLGGYHVDEVIKSYPKLNFSIIPDWEKRTALHTLLKAPFSKSKVIVSYSDTVFRKSVIDAMISIHADVTFCIDSLWKERYTTRTSTDIGKAETIVVNEQIVEFTGLIYFSEKAIKRVSQLDESDVGTNLIDLIHFLQQDDLLVKSYDIRGEWAEFNSPDDIAKFILGTKAETLARLEQLVKKSHIGKQVSFTSWEWKTNSKAVLDQITNTFIEQNLIIRSSSKAEDSWDSSNAGAYKSILNVNILDREIITQAIMDVLKSYGNVQHDEDQVLVQTFLNNVCFSGVIFTCGLESGAPYYRINFDDTTQSTESVTSGAHGDLRTVIVYKLDSTHLEKVEPMLIPVLEAVKELEQLLGFEKLDIEFAIDTVGIVHIFQVRPITVNHSAYDEDIDSIANSITNAKDCFEVQQNPSPFVYGEKTILANMPDWNPAEIIGTRPKPLAFSLYRELITNDIWAQQRFEFGYSDVRPYPLVVSMAGQPYVDVRASFNSFIPNGLSEVLKSKLVDAYMKILTEYPQFHDKIEFDIVFTVWVPGFFDNAKSRLEPYSVTENEILELEIALKKITRDALLRLNNDIKSIYSLEERRNKIVSSNLTAIDQAFALLNDCKRFGTLAFSHAARAGFIATAFLNSFVDNNILTDERRHEFLMSFQTVAGNFEEDKYSYSIKEMSLETLIEKYGHLRPGTYELAAQAYWEDPARYLIPENLSKPKLMTTFALSSAEAGKIKNILAELSSSITVNELMDYIKQSIQSRELVKFEFTKNLSKALDLFVKFGLKSGIRREDLSYLEYYDFEQIKLNVHSLDDIKENIKKRHQKFVVTQAIELPPLIKDSSDFYCFERLSSKPNFVTLKRIEALIQQLDYNKQDDLYGKIVLIPQADPGYDWLFGHGISGLITQYGGANSHMAIRAAEIGLPAAIGVGEKLYEKIANMRRVEMDCSSHIIREVT